MASYDRHSKSKSSRSYKYEENIKTTKSRHNKSTRYHRKHESKTPPLPSKSTTSIEDLLKQRNYLKEELKKIVKYSDSDLPKTKFDKSEEKYAKDDNYRTQIKYSSAKPHEDLKRQKILDRESSPTIHHHHTHTHHTSKKKFDKSEEKYAKDNNYHTQIKYSPNKLHEDLKRKKILDRESSPIIVDSEDEETIIEQRRKKRKQILEKFNDKNTTNVSIDDYKAISSDNEKCLDEQTNNNDKQLKSSCYEVSGINKKTENKINKIPDMFSEIDDFTTKNLSEQLVQDNNESSIHLTDNWDDEEGYYNIRTGDMINDKRYVIRNILGKGVFANVVQAQINDKDKMAVAIKIIRNNDLMYTTGLKEISILKKITDADPENKYHCIKMLDHFIHKGHLCIVLESLYIDLRQIIKKYGKHGLNMKALISYSRQILTALRFLEKVGVIHADIKPDNLLVNEKKNILKLSDFGSAVDANDNEATPYLVSRFYRAPEIILGISYSHGVDIWSTACTIFEMATGRILFTGNSNNKMLKCFMDLKGKIPNRLIRKGKFKDQHFNYNNNFLLHKKDEVTGREKLVEIPNINPVKDLSKELKKYCRDLPINEEKKLMQCKDLLEKMLIIDPSQRIKTKDCLKHPFVLENL